MYDSLLAVMNDSFFIDQETEEKKQTSGGVLEALTTYNLI